MGIFSKLFGSSSDIERQLKALYVPVFEMMMGMSSSQARRTFRDMLEQAKEEGLKEGTSSLPENFGDILLENESIDEKTKSMLAKRRTEGVRDADIRWWWNMHDLERRMMVKVDELGGVAMLIDSKEKGMKQNEAAERLRKSRLIYGDPDDTSHTTGDDRPLPHELKDRVNVYFEKRGKTNPDKLKREIEKSTTFNALIRREVKKGNI